MYLFFLFTGRTVKIKYPSEFFIMTPQCPTHMTKISHIQYYTHNITKVALCSVSFFMTPFNYVTFIPMNWSVSNQRVAFVIINFLPYLDIKRLVIFLSTIEFWRLERVWKNTYLFSTKRHRKSFSTKQWHHEQH